MARVEMNRWLRVTLFALATAFAVAIPVYCMCSLPTGVALQLANAEQFTIFALHPHGRRSKAPVPPEDDFHGFEILARAEVTAPELRADIVRAVDRAIHAGDPFSDVACFSPRHGIRAIVDGRPLDLLICFECVQIRIHGPGEQVDSRSIADDPTPLTELYHAAGVDRRLLQR